MPKSTIQVNIRVPAKTYADVKRIAKSLETTANWVWVAAAQYYIQEADKHNPSKPEAA